MVPLRTIRKLVDPIQVNQKQAPHCVGARLDAVEVQVFFAEVRAHTDNVTLLADDVDQLELLEERRNRLEAFTFLGSRFDGNDNGLGIVEVEAHERVSDRSRNPYEMKKSTEVRCAREISRSSWRTVKSSVLR